MEPNQRPTMTCQRELKERKNLSAAAKLLTVRGNVDELPREALGFPLLEFCKKRQNGTCWETVNLCRVWMG